MLFTYDMKIPVGNGKKISKEIDGKLHIERNGEWSIYLSCEDSGEYEPVCQQTDLHREICAWLVDNEHMRTMEAVDAAQRNYRWADMETARQ